jgi:glycosyltransferase involved in cell wall biosynthesis
MMGMKVIWEVHNIIPHNASESDKKNSRWFYEKCDALIFHSERDLCRSREMLKTDASKINIVIPHGNFNGSYENRISKKEARKILSIPDEKRVILCFGFIRRNRGYEYLMEATEKMENIEVVIAGKTLEKNVYEELLACVKTRKDVKIYGGFIPDNEVQVYFNACDFVVLPYTEITTSGVIPLAYAFSRPVITTDIGGLRDVVNKETGILVPVADAHALRGAMERLFVADLEKMGRDAHDFAEKEFSWESNAQKIKRLYELVTDSKLSKKICKDEMIEKMVA